jgi:hypothetical protein
MANKRTALNIPGNRLTAAVLPSKALGGGWNVAEPNGNGVSNPS